jgi:RNA polymerase sigma-70 factor (ECF subfamily)
MRRTEDFGGLWDSYAQAIYRYCFRRTGDAMLAEDLTSAVFLEAWRRRHDVTVPPEKALPWLYGVATNLVRNQHRRRRRHEGALRRLARPAPEPDFAEAATERLDSESEMRQILAHISDLTRLEQEVLALCVWEGLSPHEVGEALDVPVATVRTRLHRARQHLRALAFPTASNGSAPTAAESRPEAGLR